MYRFFWIILTINLFACQAISETQPQLTNSNEKLLALKLPPIEELQTICHELATLNSDARRIYGDTSDVSDINNDGIDEVIENCYGGNMHVPCVNFKLPNGDSLQENPIDYEWKTFWTYGLKIFRKNERVYSFHSYDDHFQKPAYLSYMTPENKEYVVCEFENKMVNEFVPNPGVPNSRELCNAIHDKDDSKISDVKLTQKPILSRKEIKKMGRYETGLLAQGFLDYDNDGIENYLGELEYASGAGRGCDFNYFDELDQDSSKLMENESQQLLLKMQGVNLAARHPNCGGMNNRFIQFNGQNFHELNTDKIHKISFIKKKEIIDACSVNKSIITTVKNYVRFGE